jgi:hypothetical protein
VKLSLLKPQLYRVKKGQTICSVAAAFGLPPRFLAKENGLSAELWEGQVIFIPPAERNLYTVRGGESKSLLCGSAEIFAQRNGTRCFYPAQTVFL